MWRHLASNTITFLIVGLAGAAGVIAWGVNAYSDEGPLEAAICLRVEPGTNMRSVSARLEEQGAIGSASVFRIGAEYSEKAGQLKAGSHLIPERSSMSRIVDIVTRGGASTCGTEILYKIGVNAVLAEVRELDPATSDYTELAEFDPTAEGVEIPAEYQSMRERADTRYRISMAEGVTSWQVVNALNALDTLEGDVEEIPAEGSLAPDSYEIAPGTQVGAVLDRMAAAQAAILAATIRAPSVINPEADLERARERGLVVLSVMRDLERIDEAAYVAARTEMASLEPSPPPARAGSYFADWVLGEAQELAGAVDGPLTVRATLDIALQARAEEILASAIAGRGAEAGASQGAIVVMTPDGRVRAMVGGTDYGTSQFNRATDALRQPGSTFKLPVFLAALVMGADPDTRLPDEPIDIDGYKPENFNGQYAGVVTLREAFTRSLNAATVRLAQEGGIDQVIEVSRQLGIEGDLTPTPSLALGTSEVSLLDMTEAYAAILAGRAPINATGIASLRLGDTGVALSVSDADPNAVELNRTRDPMVSMLRSVVTDGTGKRAAVDGFAAGKTGTSQNSRDAWFIGFTDKLVVGVWVGNDDNSPMDAVTGGSLPAEIWRDVVLAAGGSGAQQAPSAESQTPVRVRRGTQVSTTNGDRLRQAAAPDQSSCNVRACSRAYRSFRASDCSFQPYSGPRKLCTR